jgi:hypothetical protein
MYELIQQTKIACQKGARKALRLVDVRDFFMQKLMRHTCSLCAMLRYPSRSAMWAGSVC